MTKYVIDWTDGPHLIDRKSMPDENNRIKNWQPITIEAESKTDAIAEFAKELDAIQLYSTYYHVIHSRYDLVASPLAGKDVAWKPVCNVSDSPKSAIERVKHKLTAREVKE